MAILADAIFPARVPGADLRALRARRRIRIVDVARRMNVSRQRVGQIESEDLVTPATTERYLRALYDLRAAG